jgi:uncharacterized protein (UPF0332 family)
MTPHEFIAFAGKLAAMSSGGEAAVRTAVSRAYYGAFHAARELLADLNVSIAANLRSHGLVRQCLIGSSHAEAMSAGGALHDLHTDRIRADYELSDTRFQSFLFARSRVEKAELILTLLDRCRHEPARSEVRDAINAYLARLN